MRLTAGDGGDDRAVGVGEAKGAAASTFSAPFASPSLRWACKRRLRCFHPDSAAALRLSPSPSPDLPLRPASPFLDDDDDDAPLLPRMRDAAAPRPPTSPSRATSVPSPREPLEAAPALSARDVEEAPRWGSDPIGWSLRSGARNGENTRGRKKRRVELWVSLSREEIEEDFLWMTGAKPPPRRSRRRDKGSSHQLLTGVFPGSWMPNRVAAARYRVSEASHPGKDEMS